MRKLLNWLKWLDEHILHLLLAGFVFFIPLYFKLPVIQVDYTYIHVRLEDFYNAIFILIFVVQLARRKVVFNTKLLLWFLLFWGFVFLSFLVYAHGVLVEKFIENFALMGPFKAIWRLGVDFVTDGKIRVALLHALRRVEYMSFFFIASSLVRSRNELFWYIKLILMCMLAVVVYALGQKFLGWPAVQTMSPEYSKGYVLTLDSYTRASSTFGGHYDLAAYLVFLFPILLGVFLMARKGNFDFNFVPFIKANPKILTMVSLSLLYLGGVLTLILTASRASYMAYFGVIVPMLLLLRQPKLLVTVVVITLLMTPISESLQKRFQMAFTSTSVMYNPKTGTYIEPRRIKVGDDNAIGSQTVGKFKSIDESSLSDAERKKILRDREIIRQTVIDNIQREATASGKIYTKEELEAELAKRLGNYIPMITSVVDVSISVRLQNWPRILLEHFWRNPLLGTGPSSAGEGLDGDYIRWLVETGLLGTGMWFIILGTLLCVALQSARLLTFNRRWLLAGIGMALVLDIMVFLILKSDSKVLGDLLSLPIDQVNTILMFIAITTSGIIMAGIVYFKTDLIVSKLGCKKLLSDSKLSDVKDQYLYLGFFFGILALLINAIFFDIFEASKVAYTFWMVGGIFVGALTNATSSNRFTRSSPIRVSLIIIAFVMGINMVSVTPTMLVKNMPSNFAPSLCPLLIDYKPEYAINKFIYLVHKRKMVEARELIEYSVRSKMIEADVQEFANKLLLPKLGNNLNPILTNQEISGLDTKAEILSDGRARVEFVLEYVDGRKFTNTVFLKREGCYWVILK